MSEPEIDSLRKRIDDLEGSVRRLSERSGKGHATGVSLVYAIGIAIAVTLSWTRSASILWAMLHGFLSWAYVIYYALTR